VGRAADLLIGDEPRPLSIGTSFATPAGAMLERVVVFSLAVLFSCATAARGQTRGRYVPISGEQRVDWVRGSLFDTRGLTAGLASTTWNTAWNDPDEWGRSWPGVAKRFAAREASVAVSNSIEAGLGAIWGEDPRYLPTRNRTLRARVQHALKSVVLSPRRDGRYAPAWGRYTAVGVESVVANRWLPRSDSGPSHTFMRIANAFLGQLGSNLFREFWPDLKNQVLPQSARE
jgi:hypothetical protein